MNEPIIQTSYFAKSGKLPNAVSIARGKPEFLPRIREYKILAPPWSLVNRKRYSYEDYYEAVLKRLEPQRVLRDLHGTILCCWEKDPTHCHRRMVARWLEERLGIRVPEVL